MKLGLVIPTFNRKEKLKECLNSIFNQNFDTSRLTLYICVVNDGSNDGTNEFLDVINDEKLFVVEGDSNWFFTRCVNEGASFLSSFSLDNYMILNDDCILGDGFFNVLLDSVSKLNLNDYLMGPLTLTLSFPTLIQSSGLTKIKFFFKRYYYVDLFSVYDDSGFKGLKPSLLLPGRGMFFSRRIWESVGGFDDKFLQYHSDEDFCLSASKLGFPIFINFDLKIFNDHLSTSSSTSYKSPKLGLVISSMFDPKSRNFFPDRARILWKHHNKALFPFLLCLQYLIIFRSSFRGKK